MKTIRNILGGLFVTLLALGGGNFAKAQDTKETTKTTPVKAGKKFTPEELVVVLENLGFTPKVVEDKEGKAISIDLEIAQSGWTFRPDITWGKDQSNFFLVGRPDGIAVHFVRPGSSSPSKLRKTGRPHFMLRGTSRLGATSYIVCS
jgi:hypothetical protein